jgi:hypothetical protein
MHLEAAAYSIIDAIFAKCGDKRGKRCMRLQVKTKKTADSPKAMS